MITFSDYPCCARLPVLIRTRTKGSMTSHTRCIPTEVTGGTARQYNALLAIASQPQAGDLPRSASFASVDKRHVVIDTVKKTEDGDDIIVRLYEAYGQRGDVTLSFGAVPKEVSECNLMEEEDQVLDVSGNAVSFNTKPYELRTLKVKFK